MAAILKPTAFSSTPTSPALTPPGRVVGAGRPRLVVIDGGRSAAARRRRRVYLQRRLLVLVVAVTVAWVGVQILGGILAGGATPSAASTVGAGRIVVAPGDTLWDVAVGLGVDGDVRDAVDRLAELNGTDQLVPGQVIRIPADLVG